MSKVTFVDPSEYKPCEVRPGDFTSYDRACRKLRKLLEKDGILKRVMERERGFKKKSLVRHEKKRRARLLREARSRSHKRSDTICIMTSGKD